MNQDVRILVVDDEKVVRESLYQWFREDGYTVAMAGDAKEALQKLAADSWDIVFVDIKMPGMDGLELQRRIHQIDATIGVVIMTAYASVDTAVQALKAGAHDYITKPFDPEDLEQIISSARQRQQLLRRAAGEPPPTSLPGATSVTDIIGDSEPMQRLKALIRIVAPTDTTVLITGESGTGKELVARAIHRLSGRRHLPLVTAHCGGLPDGLIESELFGHEKGAFTGAAYRHKGKFELADGGTIFFDEIGDISTKTQIDLLRVLEEKSFTRLGGSTAIEVDFRVVAATNRDLRQAVAARQFRLDLYYRINVFPIVLPPLRERPEDLPLLVRHFIGLAAAAAGRPPATVTPEAMARLTHYHWPGNVRELQNAIERALVVQTGAELRAEDLPLPADEATPAAADPDLSLAANEKQHLQAVLDSMGGNVTRAAQALQIDRVTLYNKIRKYGLRRSG